MQIHFLLNPARLDAVAAARDAVSLVLSKGVAAATEAATADLLQIPALDDSDLGRADLMICFGGDGTLIRAADLCAPHHTPILGVYFGRFGFVTQCDPHELGAMLSLFLDGQAQFEDRMMLLVEHRRQGETLGTWHALNEMSLQRHVDAAMLSFSLEVDGHYITTYPADGVLLATPTGSTGYNLSAGGPILDPRLQAIILNALAPHTLSARPLVLSPNSTIQIKVEAESEAMLTVDGQSYVPVESGDRIRVSRSPRMTRLIQVDASDFLEKLGQRLFWSFSIMGAR